MTSDMTEEQVKKNILSILTSSPQVATITTLQRDFREIVGHPIPFYKFNYNSIEHFLKSITDICTVNNSGPYAQVYPRISENSAHINELVSRQKVNPPRRKNRGGAVFRQIRKPVIRRYNEGYNTQNYAFSPYASSSNSSCGGYQNTTYNNNFVPRVTSSSTPVPKPPEKITKPSENFTTSDKNLKNTNVYNNSNLNNGNDKSNIKTTDTGYESKQVEETPKEDKAKKENNHLGSTLVKQKLEQLIANQIKVGNVSNPTRSSSISTESLNNVQSWINSNNNIIPDNAPKEISNYLCQSHHETSIDTCTKKLARLDVNNAKETTNEDTSNVPKKVQSNLRLLISQFEDGIWVPDLPEQYRQMFRRELPWSEYGYTSLIDLCVACGHIFHYVRPERGDFKLYDRSKPLPANAEKKFTIASYDTGGKAAPIFHEDALPELDFSDFKGRIPDDIFEYGQDIPKQFLPEGTKAENVFDVVVMEIYDPSKFWFNLGTSAHGGPLDELMDQLQIFYDDPENNRRYSIPLGAVKEGLYCVQKTYGEHHRARIVRVYPDDHEHVRLLYIDYGTVSISTIKGMCFLQSDFATTPAQAIRCRLANIKPLLKAHPWPRDTSVRFRELVNKRDTKIKISYIDWMEEYVCVFLADVTDPEVVYINELLVKEKHAVWDDEKQITPFVLSNFTCKVQNLHLFPTFLELEYGMAPNAAEMYNLQEMLVPLHFCIPQYFERNIEVLSDADSDFDELESTFIETVKHHRKIIPWNKIDFRNVSRPPAISFKVFGEMKEEMMTFYNEISGTNKTVRSETNDDCLIDFGEVLEVSKNSEAAGVRRPPEYDSIRMLSEDRKITENAIKELDNYKYVNSHLSDKENQNCIFDELTPLVDSEYSGYSCAGRNNYKKYAIIDEDINELELSTILELSESEKDSTLSSLTFKPFSTLNIDSAPEVNIFDNPEAFENASASPVTPQEFTKLLEDRFFPENLGSDGQESTTNSSTPSCPNPFTLDVPFQTDDPFEVFLKRCQNNAVSVCDTKPQLSLSKDISGSISDLSSVKEESNFLRCEEKMNFKRLDLQSKSALEDTRTEYTDSLSLNNPFRNALEDQKYIEAVSEKTELLDQATGIESRSESDSSDYKVFVPKSPTLPASNNKDIETLSSDFKSSSTESQVSKISVAFDDKGSTGQMSVHAEIFVPMNVSYHQSPYGSWSLPQYPQWSNGGGGYPAPYPVYQPPPPQQQQPVRPPPGFSSVPAYAPKYQNFSSGHPHPSSYMMPRMPPPIYPAHYQGPPVHYNMQTTRLLQERDFYEAHNRRPGGKGDQMP